MGGPRRKVEWTKPAHQDLEGILDYTSLDRPLLVPDLLERFRAAADRLSSFSTRGRVIPELRSMGVTTFREVILHPWRIAYRIEERRVLILAVIDGRRRVGDLLLERLIRGS